jgi:hypothetical protein
MLHVTGLALKYLCTAIAVCTVSIAKSAAQTALDGVHEHYRAMHKLGGGSRQPSG